MKQNGGELANHGGVFSIDKGMTYKFEHLFITTARSGCVSFKPKVQRIGCQSLTGMSGSDGQK